MRADGALVVTFFLTEGLNERLVLVDLDYASANKDPMFGVPLLAHKVPIVSKAKYCVISMATGWELKAARGPSFSNGKPIPGRVCLEKRRRWPYSAAIQAGTGLKIQGQ